MEEEKGGKEKERRMKGNGNILEKEGRTMRICEERRMGNIFGKRTRKLKVKEKSWKMEKLRRKRRGNVWKRGKMIKSMRKRKDADFEGPENRKSFRKGEDGERRREVAWENGGRRRDEEEGGGEGGINNPFSPPQMMRRLPSALHSAVRLFPS